MKNITKMAGSICMIAAVALASISCKVEDPFLNNVVAPVLVDVVGADFGAPIATTANVSVDSSKQEVTLSVRTLELDKTNILDHTKGIDSIPVSGIKLAITYDLTKAVKNEKFTLPSGESFAFTAETYKKSGNYGELTTDANGMVSVTTSYKDLGLVGNKIQRNGDVMKLTWSGTHKGIAFTRFSQITVNKK